MKNNREAKRGRGRDRAVTVNPKFAEEVRKVRDAKGWSQVELAARSRVSSRTISEIETKPKKQLSETVLIKVAIGLEGDGGRDTASVSRWLQLAGLQPDEQKVSRVRAQIEANREDSIAVFEQLDHIRQKFQDPETIRGETLKLVKEEFERRYKDADALRTQIKQEMNDTWQSRFAFLERSISDLIRRIERLESRFDVTEKR